MPYTIPLNPNAHHEAVSAWFLGPKAENFDILRKCFDAILCAQRDTRLNYFPQDQVSITSELITSPSFKASVENMEQKFLELLKNLGQFSVPFFSPRYSAHMCMENSVPAILGYLSAMIGFNPNNVAFEVGPVTTMLEIQAGQQLCKMLGYEIESTTKPESVAWGHITCDGTVANLESIWAARNLKFYPLSFRDAMKNDLSFIADSFKIVICKGEEKLMRDLSTWELLNLRVGTILDIPIRLYKQYQISQAFLDKAMSPYIVQTVGKDVLETNWKIKTPQFFCSRTKHYSWPKGAAVAGIGSNNVVNVEVDLEARMDIDDLERLLRERSANHQAVYSVIAIVGTTEEGAVDPVDKILQLRENLQKELGLSFVVHADAAWGGYFASMIRWPPNAAKSYVPSIALCAHTIEQLKHLGAVDSITIDPHKSAYIPYPAGALCYRDRRMKDLLVWTAPYLNQGEIESIGIYGVEGSKPGAAATSVWLAHEVIPLHSQGLGSLLGEVSFTCRRFSAHWAAMSDDDTDFIVLPFNPLPVEKEANVTEEAIKKQKQYIREHILKVENEDLTEEAMDLLAQLGSNLNINAFACNFKVDGKPNTDIDEANYLNRRIFERLSITTPGEDPNSIPFFLTSTTFAQGDYGTCADNFKRRLGLEGNQDLFVLRNVVMSPFTTTGDFLRELAATFKQVLEEELKVVRRRDSMEPDTHHFVVQGSGKNKYLAYRPVFKKLNSCYQVILSADIDSTSSDPDVTVYLQNKEKATIQDLCSGKDFVGVITVGDLDESNTCEVAVKNVKVVKKGSLNFNDRSVKYPDSFMPFYLYGTLEECHLSHLISLDPNIQLCAFNVSLQLSPPLSAQDLQAGLIVYANGIHEASMQPFPPNAKLPQGNDFFFHAGKTMTVTVYVDPFTPSLDQKIRLDDTRKYTKKASGTISLHTKPYVDNDDINKDPWDFSHSLSGVMKEETRLAWKEAVYCN